MSQLRALLPLPAVPSTEGGSPDPGCSSVGVGSICPELGVAPLVDPGTDCEDELPIQAGPPAEVGHEMDSELEKVLIDVVSLPTMVTPVCDIDGALRVPQAECPVIALPAMSAFVIQPSMATSPAGRNFCLRYCLLHRRCRLVSRLCPGHLQ